MENWNFKYNEKKKFFLNYAQYMQRENEDVWEHVSADRLYSSAADDETFLWRWNIQVFYYLILGNQLYFYTSTICKISSRINRYYHVAIKQNVYIDINNELL